MARRYLSLTDLAAKLKEPINYGPLLERFSGRLTGEAKRNFDESHDPDGNPWQPLLRPRPRTGGADKPLADIGFLRSSMTSIAAPGSIREITSRKLVQGTNLEYGPIHQHGGVIRPRRAKYLAIPATKEAQAAGSPRNWTGDTLIFVFGKRGGVAFTKRGKGKRLAEVIQWYFAKQVTIPARPFAGINDQMASDFAEDLGEFVQAELQKRSGGN